MALQFRHFQTRLLALLLIPLLVILAVIYLAISTAYINNTLQIITTDLKRSAESFTAAINQRVRIMSTAGDLLSDDFAFKQVYATGDVPSIVSATNNLINRLVYSDFIAFTRDRGTTVVASTLPSVLPGANPPWSELIEAARQLDRQGEYPEMSDFLVLNGHPYMTAVLPLFTPGLENWMTTGFEIGEDFTENLNLTIDAQITVLFMLDGQWQINASTQDSSIQSEISHQYNTMMSGGQEQITTLAGEEYVTLLYPLTDEVHILLQRSLAKELIPYNKLRVLLLEIITVGILLAVLGIFAVSRNVTRPVRALAQGAGQIAAGNYQQRVNIAQKDELGELAASFNNMAEGLAEKEKVRDLLGKVVSPEIATELMSRELELGGEEREVTILFSDLRGFTTLCEGRSPKQILGLLNEYFSAVTAVIEQQGGVVDKYIGDAVMALFGAPMQYSDAPTRAVQAALGMRQAMKALNASFTTRSLPTVQLGIGINTDRVVVGNMGSNTRLNYTAIGDGVNLASRLEGLDKRYHCSIIVSEMTSTLAPEFLYLELDRVRVSGKQEAVGVFTPLLPAAQASEQLLATVGQFSEFMALWYRGEFSAADAQLQQLQDTDFPCPALLRLYQQRLQQFRYTPPADWDGTSTFTEK